MGRTSALVLLGHVDHGKSTIVGRLLADTGTLPEGKVEELERISRKRGMPLEWSFALDALQVERDQAITIDSTQVRLRAGGCEILLIDAPGHQELLGQMISGAAQAEAALLVVDASEGVRGQSRRHAYLARFLGVRHVIVAVNKMDLVGFDAGRFLEVERAVREGLEQLELVPTAIVPVAAREGDNLCRASARMPWYEGPTLLDAMLRVGPSSRAASGPLRFPVQDVYKFDERRIIVGRVESGVLRAGDTVVFSPADRIARVRSIEGWNGPPLTEAPAGDVAGITLDAPIFVERGDVASGIEDAPALTTEFRAHVVWLGRTPLTAGTMLTAKVATAETAVTVEAVEGGFDLEALTPLDRTEIRRGEAGWVRFRSRALLALDPYSSVAATGRCVLVDGFVTAGAGLLDLEGCRAVQRRHSSVVANLTNVDHEVSADLRARRYGHRGGVIWLTGLSGAGKSTVAMRAERRLLQKGYCVYVLDGDNLRRGMNADLGFSAEARRENIRRAGEIAALFADAGLIVIAAFISPYADDRAMARRAAGAHFHEVFVRASLAACEERDPRGLYRRARAGEIAEFTGVSAPYEPPPAPELEIDTERLSIDEAVERLVRYVEEHLQSNGA
ncbi:MAG: adenylyl-sulfate kinase [Vicinamibacterales bacterium]